MIIAAGKEQKKVGKQKFNHHHISTITKINKGVIDMEQKK